MYLRQYRGKGWPVVGDFAGGLLLSSDSRQLSVNFARSDTSVDIELKTPVGYGFAWVRFW